MNANNILAAAAAAANQAEKRAWNRVNAARAALCEVRTENARTTLTARYERALAKWDALAIAAERARTAWAMAR